MQSGDKVWTEDVYAYHVDKPHAYIKERNVLAVIESGVVVTNGAGAIVLPQDRLHGTQADAAKAAIARLVEAKSRAAATYDSEIEKVRETYLQTQPVSV